MKNIKDSIVWICMDLIKIQSVATDKQALDASIEYVKNYFLWCENMFEYEFNGKKSIVIQNCKGKKLDILFNWHLDVVPWKPEQYEPYVQWDKLFGRWALDMKSGDAIMMVLMKDLLESGFQGKKVGLMLNTDEEIGGVNWVEKLVNEEWYSAKVVIIPDGGSLNSVVYAEKWPIHLTVEANWISAHASRPWKGKNAMDLLIKFYSELKLALEQSAMMKKSKSYWSTTVSLTNVECNSWAVNIIPSKATGNFDIRYTQDYSHKQIYAKVVKLAKKNNITIVKFLYWAPLFTDPKNKYIKKYLQISKNAIWKDVKLIKDHVASDWRFFGSKWSVVLLHQPNWENLHTDGEYSEISSYEKIYQVYKEFVMKF